MGLVLRENIGRRLTVEEMDGNFLYLQSISGSAALLTITHSTAVNLINSSGITPGVSYMITDAEPGLYGYTSQFTYGLTGTTVILHGMDANHFSPNGWGQFYNPSYGSYSVWDYTGNTEYSIGDFVIYGGQVWQSLTGNLGNPQGDYIFEDSTSYIQLDTYDWQVMSYNSGYYSIVWDEIEYSVVDDFILSRYDAYNNNLVSNPSQTYWFYCNVNPIQAFRWGASNNFSYCSVVNCTIKDSYLGCLNFVNGNISDIELNGFSNIYSINMENDSSIQYIIMNNNSSINNFDLQASSLEYITINNGSIINNFNIYDGGYLEYINLTNYSSITYFTLHSGESSLENIDLSNNSYISDFDLYNGSYLYNVNIINGSYISYFALSTTGSDSYFQEITLSNNAYINNVYLYNGSYFENIIINNQSGITQIYLCDASGSGSFLQNIEMNNYSYFTNYDGNYIYLEDGSSIVNIKMYNYSSIIGPIIMQGGSYINTMTLNDSVLGGPLDGFGYVISLANTTYLINISLTDAYISNLTFTNSYINNVNINNAFFGLIQADNNSYINEVNISNGCFNYNSNYVAQTFGYDDNTDWIYLTNNSYMNDISIENSLMTGYIHLDNSSYFHAIKISNFSTLDGVYSNDGDSVNDIGDYNYGISLNNSNIINLSLNNSSLFGMGYFYLNYAAIYNISLNNFSYIKGYLYIDTSGFGHVTLDNHSKLGRGKICG